MRASVGRRLSRCDRVRRARVPVSARIRRVESADAAAAVVLVELRDCLQELRGELDALEPVPRMRPLVGELIGTIVAFERSLAVGDAAGSTREIVALTGSLQSAAARVAQLIGSTT